MIEQGRVRTAEADVAATVERASARQFRELLAARDFDRLAATLASDAHARFLLPHGREEYDGRDAIVARIRSWFGSATVLDLTSSTEDEVGMRHRISWRFSVVRDGSRQVIEQFVYVDLGHQGIDRIDLLCSGFQAEPSVDAGPTQIFDAEIMLLLSNSRGLFPAFLQAFEDAGVPYVPPKEDSWIDTEAGRFMLGVLRIVCNPEQDYVAHRLVLGCRACRRDRGPSGPAAGRPRTLPDSWPHSTCRLLWATSLTRCARSASSMARPPATRSPASRSSTKIRSPSMTWGAIRR
jgi:hypothetical protein